MKLKPLHDQVLIKRVEQEKVSEGGILFPETGEKPNQGIVIDCGAGKRVKGERIGMDITIGDRVIFAWNAGYPVKLDGEDYLIMKEEDLFGVLE